MDELEESIKRIEVNEETGEISMPQDVLEALGIDPNFPPWAVNFLLIEVLEAWAKHKGLETND